jgi:hypothetical protein
MKAMKLFFSAVIFLAAVQVGAGPVPDPKKLEQVVHIEFVKPEYVYTTAEVAKGIKIEYRITVDQDVSNLIPLPHGPSSATPPGPSGLYPLERIAGNSQNYCLLDFGLGAPPQDIVRPVKKGTYTHSFTWDGRNWGGPSDTGLPKGPPFPPGEYTLSVTLHGKLKTATGLQPYTISKSVKLVLK